MSRCLAVLGDKQGRLYSILKNQLDGRHGAALPAVCPNLFQLQRRCQFGAPQVVICGPVEFELSRHEPFAKVGLEVEKCLLHREFEC